MIYMVIPNSGIAQTEILAKVLDLENIKPVQLDLLTLQNLEYRIRGQIRHLSTRNMVEIERIKKPGTIQDTLFVTKIYLYDPNDGDDENGIRTSI